MLTPYLYALWISLAIVLLLEVLSFSVRPSREVWIFRLIGLVNAWWLVAVICEILSPDLPQKIFWARARFLALPWLSILMLVLALERYRRAEWLTWPRLAPLLVIPGLTVVFSLSGDLMRSYLGINPQVGSVVYQNNLWYYVYIIYVYVVYLASGGLFLASIRSSPRLYARQTAILVVALIIVMFSDITFQLHWMSYYGVNPTPALIWLSTLLLALAVYRLRMLDITPIAQSTIFANLSDPLLILDEEDRLVGFNPAAQEILKLSDDTFGRPFMAALAGWPPLVNAFQHYEEQLTLVKLDLPSPVDEQEDQDSSRRIYEFTLTPICQGNRQVGRIGRLLDVTLVQQSALQVERLYGESHRRAEEMSMLYEISLGLSANLDLQRLVETISSELKRIFGVQGSFVALYDGQTGFVDVPSWVVNGDHIPVQPLPPGYGFTQKVIATRQPLLVNRDFASLSAEMGLAWPAELKGRFPKSWLSVPMLVGDQVVGSISVQNFLTEDAFDDEDVRLLSTIAVNVGIALTNARLYERVQGELQERIRVEASLRTFSRAVEQSANAIMITDVNGLIEFVNPAFQTLTGYSPLEVIEGTPRQLKSGQMPDELYKELWRTIKSGEAWGGEMVNRKKDGSLYWAYLTISPVKDTTGEITHFVAVQEDITALKQAEDELRKAMQSAETANRSKSAFLASVSHELRTPLAVIVGYGEIMQQMARKQGLQTFDSRLGKLLSAAQLLVALINDILDFSKIEAGRMVIQAEKIAVPALVKDVVESIRPLAEQNGNTLVVDLCEDCVMYSDALRVRQVLNNLMNNACKFTRQGTITLTVRQVEYQSDVWLYFDVQDTGIGIGEVELDQLFQPFTQADASTTRTYGGTGLGLAISQQLARLMGGNITVKSKPGEGSTFSLELPQIAPNVPADEIRKEM